ncbi:MAG: hypothetical protein GY809_29755, partial [Planctomycetes bacterium]|nr:hypothetical protein [Planctomycetota bacterium]
LSRITDAPLVFVEYAAGLEPEFYASLFERCTDVRRLSAAIDVGHVGIHVCRSAYQEQNPQEDVCALHPESPELPVKIDSVQQATSRALPAVLDLIDRLTRLDRPLHFHLHDGHPLSPLSHFGVSDHLSFLQQIHLPFAYHGRNLVKGMFGVSGLRDIIHAAMKGNTSDRLSLMLEMHPMEGQTPLREHTPFFSH